MANEEHLAILKQGVKAWNAWRAANRGVRPDLSGAFLLNANLEGANLKGAFLKDAGLVGANLEGANLEGAFLKDAFLFDANLIGANLIGANLYRANLRVADLVGTNLKDADLVGASLNGANLKDADLRDTNLSLVQALHTNFESANLTGACIQDWHINAETNLNDVTCDYVFLKWDSDKQEGSERRPSNPNKNFAPGEFTKLFQKAQETVDLIFRNGVDWQALLISLDKLRVEADGAEFPIQAIENKDDGDFVVRLKTPPEANKAEVEKFVRQEYETQLRVLESQYRTQLHAKDEQIEIYRQQNADLKDITRILASRPVIITNTNTLEATAMSNSQSSGDTYNGNIKATNFAPRGTASGGTFNDYSQTITNNLDEIGQLIKTLRSQAEQFPPNARNEVLEHLDDLQADLQHPEQVKPSRLKAALSTILAIAVGIATATDFANNVLELGKKFDIELVQPQGTPSAPSPPSPHSQGTQTVDVKRLDGGAP